MAPGSSVTTAPPDSVLVYAATPPPLTGQAICSEILLQYFEAIGLPHEVVNLSRAFRTGSVRRSMDVARYPIRGRRALRRLPGRPITYLQLGGSGRAMMRDLPLLLQAHAMGSPVVVHVHGAVFRRGFDALPGPLRAVYGRALARVRRAIVLGESLRSMFDGLIAPERVVVVDNGVQPPVAACAARTLAVPSVGGLQVLFLSNLIAAKGYPTVLEAARLSQARGLGHRFDLVGAETEWTDVSVRDFVRRHALTNVAHPGVASTSEKLRWLERADVLVLPSALLEGQPLTLLEAMHFGMPVITTHRGGIADLIVDGEHGRVIGADDAEGLIDALNWLSDSSEYRRISAHNRAQARSRFTAEAHGARVVEILAAVAAE